MLLSRQHEPPRHHIEHFIPVRSFKMNCLAETKSGSDTTEVTCGHIEHSQGVIIGLAVTSFQQARISNIASCTKEANNSRGQSQKESFHWMKRIIDLESAGFSPLKHYLNSLYGNDVEDPNAKFVRIIEPVSQIFVIFFNPSFHLFLYICNRAKKTTLMACQVEIYRMKEKLNAGVFIVSALLGLSVWDF